MDISNYHIQFQSEGVQNFLTVDLPAGAEIIEYCLKILEKNRIPGLLMLNHQFLNGEMKFKYSVNGKRSIKELVQSGNTNEKNEVLILKNLIHALKTMNTYLIDLDKVWLDPEYLYIGDGMQVFMVCVPVEDNIQQNISQNLKNFFLELLSNYLGSGTGRYSEMFMWVYKQSIFDLELFEKEFLDDKKRNVQNSSEQMYNKPIQTPKIPAAPGPNNVSGEKPQSFNSNKDKNPKDPLISKSVAIPGGAVMNTPDGKSLNIPGFKPQPQNVAEVNESKDKKKFGINIFGQKKEKKDSMQVSGIKPLQGVRPYIVHKGRKVDITRSPFSMGQGSGAYPVDYVIADNPRVSHRHAIITEEDGNYYLQDNNSTNGTMLNGMDLQPGEMKPLKDGDEIRLYNEIICFYLT